MTAAAVKLYGTTTSPYTRKIRILVAAAGLPAELVDTRTEAGATALSRVAPLGKVPVLETPELVLPDSGLIAAWLWDRHGHALTAAGFSLAPDDWKDRALCVAVEGLLDAAINRFYLLRDGVADIGYVTRQRDRVLTTLRWLDARVGDLARPVTPSTLSLGCALDWMLFRHVADLSPAPRLRAFHEAWLASALGAGTEPA
jgi:glutathione S-transferase